MIRRYKFFPWRVFWKFVIPQLFSTTLVLLVLGFCARLVFRGRFSGLPSLQNGLAAFDEALFFLIFCLIVTLTVLSIWIARNLVFPLQRLLVKAQTMLRPSDEVIVDDDIEAEEPGEWADLETALNRIRRDLSRKAERLSREHSEIEAVMGAVSDAILAVDRQGTPLFFNSQFALLFGSQKLPIKNMGLGELFRAPELLEAYRSVLQSGESTDINVRLHLRPEHGQRHYSLSVAPLRRPQEREPYGAVGIFHDISELKRAEQIRIDFVGNVSHELRTPLTSIKGYTDTLFEDIRQRHLESAEQYFPIIRRNVDRLMELIADLLDLSSLESGGDLNVHEIPTAELTERVLKQVESHRHEKGHSIEVHTEAPFVFADARRAEQVLTNLIDNAIKYVPASGKISVSWESGAAKEVILRVRDNGPGIPSTHQGRLFERFYRVDEARSREIGGTGLGLAIVKHIMQRHGGGVSVHSTLGQGTEFVCRFPLAAQRS